MQFLVPLPGVGSSEHSELGSIGDKDNNDFEGSNSAHGFGGETYYNNCAKLQIQILVRLLKLLANNRLKYYQSKDLSLLSEHIIVMKETEPNKLTNARESIFIQLKTIRTVALVCAKIIPTMFLATTIIVLTFINVYIYNRNKEFYD